MGVYGLKIGGDSVVVGRSTATTWWFGAVVTVDSLSLTSILSLKLDVGFSFALNFCCGY